MSTAPRRAWKYVTLAALTAYTICVFGLIKIVGWSKRIRGWAVESEE